MIAWSACSIDCVFLVVDSLCLSFFFGSEPFRAVSASIVSILAVGLSRQ